MFKNCYHQDRRIRGVLWGLMDIRFEDKCYITYTCVDMGQCSCFWNCRSESSPPSTGWALASQLRTSTHLFSQRFMFWKISASTLESNAICMPNFENLTFHTIPFPPSSVCRDWLDLRRACAGRLPPPCVLLAWTETEVNFPSSQSCLRSLKINSYLLRT